MIREAETALQAAGYATARFETLVRVDMPAGYRAMTLADGAALGTEAFSSQAMLNHVLEEELRHLAQKAEGKAEQLDPRRIETLEQEVDEQRRFPRPKE